MVNYPFIASFFEEGSKMTRDQLISTMIKAMRIQDEMDRLVKTCWTEKKNVWPPKMAEGGDHNAGRARSKPFPDPYAQGQGWGNGNGGFGC